MDMDSRTKNVKSGKSGNIILLGDGTEVLTDHSSSDMLENEGDEGEASTTRGEREGTPGPEERSESSPSPTHAEQSDSPGEARMKAASDTPLSPSQKEQLEQK